MAIHPIVDMYVRKTWALLVEKGYNVTYSTVLNFMLLGAIFEAAKEGGWSKETRELVYNFLEDEETIKELNLEDALSNYSKGVSKTARER